MFLKTAQELLVVYNYRCRFSKNTWPTVMNIVHDLYIYIYTCMQSGKCAGRVNLIVN